MASAAEEVFDLVVIGGGPAGYVGAIRAAQLGFKTACIEKGKTFGGTCLNVGCIPSKALLDSSEKYEKAHKEFSKHGIKLEQILLDLPQMLKRKDQVVSQLTKGVAGLLKKNKVTAIHGFARLVSTEGEQKKIEVQTDAGNQVVLAKQILLATGSAPIELPFMPFDGKRILSSTEALSIPEVPKHLVVVGGGVIGLELGSVWMRLGAKVTVIEFMDKLLPRLDRQVAKEVEKSLKKQGMEFHFATKCLGANVAGDQITVEAEVLSSGEKKSFECDYVLVSTGRRPFTDGLGLESVGIESDEKGRVKIDSHYRTNQPGVFAVGDIVTGPMLAHKAEEEAIAAVEIMAGQAGHVNYAAIPDIIYVWPEIASVGLSEDEAKEKGIQVRTGTFPFMANGRAKAMDENDGIVKIVADAQTDRLLGAHIFGPNASELIAEAVSVLEFGGSAEDIARTCHAHPTLSESVKEAAMDVGKRRIHL